MSELRNELNDAIKNTKVDTDPGLCDMFNRFLDVVKEDIKAGIEADGNVMPMGILFVRKNPDTLEYMDKPGLIFIMPDGGMNEAASKDRFAKTMKDAAKRLSAVGSVFVSEAWVVMTKDKTVTTNNERPSNHPDRKENVIIVTEHISLGNQMFYAEIVRQGVKTTIKEFEKMDIDGGTQEGRFVNILEEIQQGAN